MSRSTVAVVRCATYDTELVYQALSRGVALLGGTERFVMPGENLLLKPNLLAGDPPERAVTTHPSVLAGCARLFRDAGAAVQFGDSPGLEGPARAASRAGFTEVAARSGAQFVDFSSGSPMENPDSELIPRFPVAQPVHECDALVNLPKMKTHQLVRITGAVKNLYGCIPGRQKALYHVQFRDVTAFSTLLVEVALRLRPRLHVMDGIVAMEGNGPRGGDPRPVGVLILSPDPVAVDAVFCRLVDLEPEFVPTNVIGERRGLGWFQRGDVELVGDDLEDLIVRDFKIVRKPVPSYASYLQNNVIKRIVLPRPVIDAHRCIRCGCCVEACPVPEKALRFRGARQRPPRYDYDLCIRCFCCHESCPERAIDKRTPLLGRILGLG